MVRSTFLDEVKVDEEAEDLLIVEKLARRSTLRPF